MKVYMRESDWRQQARRIFQNGVVHFPMVGIGDPDMSERQKIVSMKAELLKEYPHGWMMEFNTGKRKVRRFLQHRDVVASYMYGELIDLTVSQSIGHIGRPKEKKEAVR